MRAKYEILRLITLVIVLLQTGCGIGGHWMTGDPSAGVNVKPYIAYWEKEGMTEESRLEDWIACGGFRNGGVGINMQDRLPSESQAESQNRQQTDFQRCILSAGYHYMGDCSSDWAKTRPACGAP